MINFDWTSFTLKIAIKANIQTIYDAWTSSIEIEKWFLSKAEFRNEKGKLVEENSSVTENSSYTWNWFLYEETESGKITQANGINLFEFTFAGDCLVTIKLSTENEQTVISLTQHNIPTDENSKRNIRLGCHNGWSFYLVNLKSVYEGGLDLRNKDNRFKPMINN